jgi:hypothetical protein
MESGIKPTIGRNVFGCLGIAIGVFLLFVLLMAYAVAKTGLFHVPLLSNTYRGPTPSRLVSAQPMTLDAFRVLLASRFISEANAGKKPPYVVRVSEAELTGALMGGVERSVRSEAWREAYAQAVIHPDGIEVLLKLERGAQTADFLMRFTPHVENGSLQLEPTSFRFGDYPIPVSMAQRLAGAFFDRDFGTTTVAVGEAKLSEIRLREGSLEIVASPGTSTP